MARAGVTRAPSPGVGPAFQLLAEWPVGSLGTRHSVGRAILGEESMRRPGGPALATIAIGIHPTRDLLRRAIDFQALFTLLDTMGTLTVSTRLDELPALADLDPADCYLSFDICLAVEGGYAGLAVERARAVLDQYLRPHEFALQAGAAETPGNAA